MTIHEAACQASAHLRDGGIPDPEQDALLMLSFLTGLSPMEVRLQAEQPLTEKQEQRLASLLLSRAKREPLQYLLGEQWFYGLRFLTDGRALIPRQETETLCELGLTYLKALDNPAVLELCTGSGAVAVTVKRECPQARVTATDLSPAALSLARENAALHRAEVRFLEGDLLAPVAGERFHLILANPPYVTSAACDCLQPEVTFEPRMALNGGPEGLDFYRRIAAEAGACLFEGGMLAVEVGDGQADAVKALLALNPRWQNIVIHNDLYGKRRVVSAYAANPT